MKIRWAATLFLISISVSACATEAGYRKTLDRWIGSSERDLVSAWGPPQGFYESSGTRFLTYSNRRDVYMPGTPPSYQTNFIGNTAYTTPVGGTSPMLINMACETTFTVEGTRIASYRYRGNNCVAKAPK